MTSFELDISTAKYSPGGFRLWAAALEPWLLCRIIGGRAVTALPGETLDQTQARAALTR